MKKLYSVRSILFLCVLSFTVVLLLLGTAHAEKKNSHKFTSGQCTWYVANQNDFYIAYINFSGNAGTWLSKADANHYKIKPNTWRPKKYSIVVASGGEYGHVALVNKIEKGKNRFRVTDMNYCTPECPGKVKEHYYNFGDSRIKGFILTKKAIEQYEDDDKDQYKKLKKQYKSNGIWFDGKRQ